MSWRAIEDGMIYVAQQKSGNKIWIALHPRLNDLLSRTKKDHVCILVTEHQKPFSIKGLGNWMAKKIAAAGLPDECVTHGLRKAAARRLAEAGCTEKEIAAVTRGDKSLSEVQRYTKAANQKRLSTSAIEKLTSDS